MTGSVVDNRRSPKESPLNCEIQWKEICRPRQILERRPTVSQHRYDGAQHFQRILLKGHRRCDTDEGGDAA